MTIWDELDAREARYKAARDSTLELIKGILSSRFPPTCSECGRDHEPIAGHDLFDNPVGEVVVGQDEFGWWRASVTLSIGFHGPEPAEQWRDLTYQARSSEGLVQAVREKREAA